MSKESGSREVEQCPGCGRDFAFVIFHIPSCAAAMMRQTKELAKIRRRVESPYQTAAVANAAMAPPVADKKFKSNKRRPVKR